MEFIKAFTYVLEDDDWAKKILVGAIVTAIPVVEAISNGYQIRVIENIKAGQPKPLPAWEDMGAMFNKGIMLWVAVNIFYIPSAILSALGAFVGLPWLSKAVILLFAETPEQKFFIHVGIPLLSLLVAALLAFCTLALPFAFMFVPAMALRCAETGSFLATLNPISLGQFILRHLGDYVLARLSVFGMLIAFSLVASAVGGSTIWLLGLGALLGWLVIAIARFWGRLMWAYYLAQMRLQEKN